LVLYNVDSVPEAVENLTKALGAIGYQPPDFKSKTISEIVTKFQHKEEQYLHHKPVNPFVGET
jgi:hypothetical protein